MFHASYDRRANCLNIVVKGFLQPHDVVPLAKAIGDAAQTAKSARDDFDVLVDSLDFPVQANDVADLLPGIMRAGMVLTTGRAAVVVGSQLNKAQAERTLVHDRVRVFMDMNTAHAWLKQAA